MKKENLQNVEEICRQIEQQAQQEINDIIEKAKAAAQDILKKARQSADHKVEVIIREAEKEAAAEKEKILSTLNIEKKTIMLKAKQKIIDAVISELRKISQQYRSNKDGYRSFLLSAVSLAAASIGSSNQIIKVSSRDKDLFNKDFLGQIEEKIKTEKGRTVHLEVEEGDFDDIGVVLTSLDKRVIYDIRFETILTQFQDKIRAAIMEKVNIKEG